MTSEYWDLAGRVALITGRGGAIGQAISAGLIRVGAKVTLVDIAGDRLQSWGAQLASQAGPGRVLTVVADVCDSQQVKRAFDLTMEEFGRLDILVSNAGILIAEAVGEFPAEKWRQVLDVNLYGYSLTARHAARVMKEQRSGAIQIN